MQVLLRDKNDIHSRWDRATLLDELGELKKVRIYVCLPASKLCGLK